MQVLLSREDRANRQRELLKTYGVPLVCFTMNIPGPVKQSPLIRRTFRHGLALLEARLPHVLYREVREPVTGCEAFLAVAWDDLEIKKICTQIEDETPMGRVFDMDVLDSSGGKLDRSLVGGRDRGCIVCGAPGRGCASRRIHSAEELSAAINNIMSTEWAKMDAGRMAGLVVKSLVDEVRTTPKPGLVDEANSGSHSDMDLDTFLRSADALWSYFYGCVRLGQRKMSVPETFSLLRRSGRKAEKLMYRTTGGVNTHKGAIFTMGLLCGSLGMLWEPEKPIPPPEKLLETCADLANCALEQDFASLSSGTTAGERLYLQSGLTGIRGEAAAGLPSVTRIGLPAFRKALEQGFSLNDAGAVALLHLIAQVEDTNLYHRGGADGAAWAKKEAEKLLPLPAMDRIRELDEAFIRRNLSPGGCADLLAVTLFLHKLDMERAAV